MPSRNCSSLKRAAPAQWRRREAEHQIRLHAVAFRGWAVRQGLSCSAAARRVGVCQGTLDFWNYRSRKHDLSAALLGRPCRRSSPQVRNDAIDLLGQVGPHLSAAAIQVAFPKMARREAQNLHARFRRIWKRDHRRLIHVLHWHTPRAVWAMDHVEPPCPIDDRWPYLLAIRDLASGCQLAWLPVADQSAETTRAVLEELFLEHGPPLVAKSDNGSGFISELIREFLRDWQVWSLFSPPYTPQYNGAVEAGNGALKIRTRDEAVRLGRPGLWSVEDCEAARCMANELNYPRGPASPSTHRHFHDAPRIPLEVRAAFGRTVRTLQDQERRDRDYPLDETLEHDEQARIDRVAIRRTLVEFGFLSFTRRSIAPQLKSHSALNIT